MSFKLQEWEEVLQYGDLTPEKVNTGVIHNAVENRIGFAGKWVWTVLPGCY